MTDSNNQNSIGGHVAIGGTALVSGFGFWAIGEWLQPATPVAQFTLAAMRTLFTLLPALVAFWVASKRQREVEARMAKKLDKLKGLLDGLHRLQVVENELKTMDRLAKVARNTVTSTGASSQELFHAIEAVKGQERGLLLERYRYHTGSMVTVLNAVNEELSESGRAISEALTADQEIDVVERADRNAEDGLKYAKKIIENRGINAGLDQLKMSINRAQSLQGEITSAVQQMSQPTLGLSSGGEVK